MVPRICGARVANLGAISVGVGFPTLDQLQLTSNNKKKVKKNSSVFHYASMQKVAIKTTILYL
jgi:hypothetical protein